MDPISDMLIRLKNASAVRRASISLPYSKLKNAIGEVLLKEGFVASVVKRPRDKGAVLEIELVYKDKKPKIKGVKRISKPSRRVYYGVSEIRSVKSGYGTLVLSTPKGILTGKDAKKELVGGEALFNIW